MTRRELELLRTEVERLDSEILRLVAEREETAREIGLVKRKDGLKIRDKEREDEVVRRFEEAASAHGISKETARALARLLISDSVAVQREKAPQAFKGRRVLVVGGAGRMGQWTCRLCSDRGADVTIYDKRGGLDGYRSESSLVRAVASADMIVVASPLGTAADDLEAVFAASPKGLVFDLCSVKSHIAKCLVRAASRGYLVTSVHPMFGPGVPNPAGRNVVVCRCGCPKADQAVSDMFRSLGANVSIVDLSRHDELMAYVLGLSHLCALLFARSLERSRCSMAELEAVQGPTFKRLATISRELSRESKRVYHDIQALNPHTRRVLSGMEAVLRELRKASLDPDPSEFGIVMDSVRKYMEGE